MKTQRKDKYRLRIEKSGDMLVDATVYAPEELRVESSAIDQLVSATRIPSVVKVLATPDIHHGFGVPIGSVVATEKAVVPAAVGYDINCGMRLLTTPLARLDFNVEEAANSIQRSIPLGEGKRNVSVPQDRFEAILDRGIAAFDELTGLKGRVWESRDRKEEREDMDHIEDMGSMPGSSSAMSSRAISRGLDQLATLGGGNHFIEIQEVIETDESLAPRFGIWIGQVVIMIHSGSRGLGHQIGGDYMKLASVRNKLPGGLAYLDAESRDGRSFVKAMNGSANFAFANRQLMTVLVRRDIRHIHGDIEMPTVYDVPHNMVKREKHGGRLLWVHRKGATRAFPGSRMPGDYADIGQPVLIPGSMGTASYLLVGTEAGSESLFSVNHGAGRTMSRTEASGLTRRGKHVKAAISDQRFAESMSGIKLICAEKRRIKEEAPDAYKDIDLVVDTVAGAGLASIVAKMRPLAVLKG